VGLGQKVKAMELKKKRDMTTQRLSLGPENKWAFLIQKRTRSLKRERGGWGENSKKGEGLLGVGNGSSMGAGFQREGLGEMGRLLNKGLN